MIEFNDEQKAKMGSALQALANEISNERQTAAAKCSAQEKDIIELLSDSDGDESAMVRFANQNDIIDITNDGDDASSTTLSVYSESSDMRYKFIYDETQTEKHNQFTQQEQQQRPSIANFVTLTDISGEQIKVKEVNICTDAFKSNNLKHTRMPVKLSANEDIAAVVGNREMLRAAKDEIEIEEPRIQSYYEGMVCGVSTTDAPPPPSVTTIYSCNDNNNRAQFHTQCVDIDDMYDAELSAMHSEEETFIDLVDSDTETENQLTTTTTMTKKRANKSDLLTTSFQDSTSSIDRFIKYQCPQCGIECGTSGEWKLHTDIAHKFNTIESLNMQNVLNRAGQVCHQCRDCAQQFELTMHFSRLLQHRISHLPHEQYVHCVLCKSKFRSKPLLQRHLVKTHNKTEYLQKRIRPGIYTMQYIKISCPICEVAVDGIQMWKDHLDSVHNFSIEMMSNVAFCTNNIYICMTCNTKISKLSIMDHMLLHQPFKSFSCTYCNNYKAVSLRLVVYHVSRSHLMSGKECLFKCYYCLNAFTTTRRREQHVLLEHMRELPKCAICNKEFINISKLFWHMKIANHYKLE